MRSILNFLLPLLFGLFLCTGVRAQSDIPVSYPTDYITKFRDIYVDNSGLGYAAGTCGVLRQTTNNGESWSKVASPTNQDIQSIVCSPTGCSTALLTTDDGIYRRAGSRWSKVNFPAFEFTEELHWISGQTVIHESQGEGYDRSTDGGASWTRLPLPDNQSGNMSFIGDRTIFVWAGSSLLKSTDAGANFSPSGYTHPEPIREQTWLDADRGWIFDAARLFYATTDGGSSWTLLNADSQLTSVNWFVALSETHLVGAQITTFRIESTDGGVTWTRGSFLENGNERVNEKYHRRGDEFFLVGDQNQLLYSPAGFDNFVEREANARQDRTDKMAFATNTLGYAAGLRTLLVTTDAGENWTEKTIPQSARDMAVLPNGNLLVIGSGSPLVSINQGDTFENLLPTGSFDSGQQPEVIALKPNGEVYLMGRNRSFVSTDGGATYSAIDHNLDFSSSAIFFLDANNGYVVSRSSEFATTSDGGNSWTAGLGPANNLVDVFFTDANNGWASDASTRYVTTDRGMTWTRDSDRNGGYDFTRSPDDGSIIVSRYTSGNNGAVSRSKDDGATWSVLAENCYAYRSGAITPDGKYWFSGGDGLIVRHDLETLISSTPRRSIAAEKLSAYPNPTSGEFTVELPVIGATARLSLFDGSGRQLREIAVAPGQGRMDISLANLPAGVYYIRWMAEGRMGRVRVVRR